jgi:hypothetical protein
MMTNLELFDARCLTSHVATWRVTSPTMVMSGALSTLGKSLKAVLWHILATTRNTKAGGHPSAPHEVGFSPYGNKKEGPPRILRPRPPSDIDDSYVSKSSGSEKATSSGKKGGKKEVKEKAKKKAKDKAKESWKKEQVRCKHLIYENRLTLRHRSPKVAVDLRQISPAYAVASKSFTPMSGTTLSQCILYTIHMARVAHAPQ